MDARQLFATPSASPESGGSWVKAAADVLGCDEAVVAGRSGSACFAALGGTSLQAMEFAALAAQRYGQSFDLEGLLGPVPLAEVAASARRAQHLPSPAIGGGSSKSVLSRAQLAMLLNEKLYGGAPFHLLFSADIRGLLDRAKLSLALSRLTVRYPSLRVVFAENRDSGALTGRVLPSWSPSVIDLHLPLQLGTDLVADVHGLLAPAAAGLLQPFHRPPVVFVLSHVSCDRAVLSMLAHHVVLDGWSIGLMWRELAAEYASLLGGENEAGIERRELPVAASAPEISTRDKDGQDALQKRLQALDGIPTTVEIPSDLRRPGRRTLAGTRLIFTLSNAAQQGCTSLASELGMTRNTVLLAAWALVIGRRAATPALIMGMAAAGRQAESFGLVGQCTNLLPVPCRFADGTSMAGYLRQVASAMRAALDARQIAFEDIVAALGLGGDDSRNPLVQVAFAAHDELIPTVLQAGNLTLKIREGHCGGTSFDALLYVQRWGDSPQLAVEYATSVITPQEAAELAHGLDHTLTEMATGRHGLLADVRTMTQAQRRYLASLGAGPEATADASLWSLVEQVARRRPDAVAVRGSDVATTISYRDLVRAAAVQSAELASAGVSEGDCVALAVQPSVHEIVAILAVLRLGAAYVGVDPSTPLPVMGTMLDAAEVRVVLAGMDRLTHLTDLPGDRAVLAIRDPWRSVASDLPVPQAVAAGPGHIAYVAFTSGSTGIPKGTRVPHRGVVRLTLNPGYLRAGASERFMRLAPLAFDASTLEIFAPLLAGGTIEIFPGQHAAPAELADFLHDREITGLWLTAGLFRLAADYRPDAFTGVRQLLTGGDVVPARQVACVLRACPDLRVTNGYGPTENTTFTTIHHLDDPAEVEDPLPIGRPIQGTGVLILDAEGRLVPRGGIGELHTYGDGLAVDYAGLPAQTAKAFGTFSPDTQQRLYRTGDLARWDAAGRLQFLGRRDNQVKIRGFRIELDQVASVLREHPSVRDAAVVATGSVSGDRRLLAGIVATGTTDNGSLDESLRRFAVHRLPGYAVPSLWAFLDGLPVTRNGKLDTARLHTLAAGPDGPPAPSHVRDSTRWPPSDCIDSAPLATASVDRDTRMVQVIAEACEEVLGRTPHIRDDYLAAGGDSLQLMRLAATLRKRLPDCAVTIQDLYACQTISTLIERLHARPDRIAAPRR